MVGRRGARRGSTLARIMSEDEEEEANPSVPNVLIYVMDDVDLERVPLFAEQDAGAAAQLAELRSRRISKSISRLSHHSSWICFVLLRRFVLSISSHHYF